MKEEKGHGTERSCSKVRSISHIRAYENETHNIKTKWIYYILDNKKHIIDDFDCANCGHGLDVVKHMVLKENYSVIKIIKDNCFMYE